LAQLERDYGREVANAIFNTVGNKITGSVVAETAKKLSDMIGKTIQQRAIVGCCQILTNRKRSRRYFILR